MKLLLILLLGEMNSFDIITLQNHKSLFWHGVFMLISYMFKFSQRPQTSLLGGRRGLLCKSHREKLYMTWIRYERIQRRRRGILIVLHSSEIFTFLNNENGLLSTRSQHEFLDGRPIPFLLRNMQPFCWSVSVNLSFASYVDVVLGRDSFVTLS